ncbi:MAG TPA: alpha-amylase family glycosyl hydrolase [Albitalea sp.]|uniref:alpha-amylase family glycosyl hydrolase n=1 Tax=Piscinibacter sp. TaxID=1903157 RepID=UPI002ED0498C
MRNPLALLVLSLSMGMVACTSAPPSSPAPAMEPAAPAAAASAPAPAASAPLAVSGDFADNPIVYFVITDRFDNGNPGNDSSYGRRRETAARDDVGTFHGGDLKGITHKLSQGWFKSLGVNAIWITAPYEQIHGWVVGGNKEFKHYAYHGYYALDYTRLDANMGTPEELREMVDTAHAQGIRILFDVVMNHPGYLDIQTAAELGVRVLWPGYQGATLRNYHSFIDYNNFAFGDWWGRPWVRSGLPGYIEGGRDDLTMQLAFLPDFRTESTEPVKLPVFLRNKPGTGAVDLPDTPVRGYLVKWLTDWVREYGIDGFRADTVKHVEGAAWLQLKTEAVKALADWKAKNPAKKIDDQPFWMVGEYWGLGPQRHRLHDFGFDAMINFDFQKRGAQFARPDALFAEYAGLLAGRPGFSTLSYLSSHDTELFDRQRLAEAGTALMLAPGAVQIFYGDESGRLPGPVPASDPQQATRSDMNWASVDQALLAHWRKLGTFRARHVALARGAHQKLGDTPYTFGRIDATSDDRVVVALGSGGEVGIPVAPVFPDGQWLHDAYSGQHAVVTNGTLRLSATGPVLLERSAAPAR